MTNKSKRQIFFSILLYALPIIFFIVGYFLLTTSGEDIWQGANNFRANTELNPLGDAINAFNFNSRITDMYAWPVIDFYDYQFAFGPDIIFRLVDVLLASATFYLATYLILARRPKLIVKDALVFCACFCAVILTPFGRPFYIEFSMIHNYVPLAFSTLLFSIPYINLIRKSSPTKHPAILAICMLFLGFYFGMAATITPLAFLITIIIYCISHRKSFRTPPAWFWTGLIGVIAGFAICWFAGTGVDHYTSSAVAANFDYVALGDIFTNPATTFSKLLWHEVYNFGITILPLLALFLVGAIFSKTRRNFFSLRFYRNLPSHTKNTLLALIIFAIIHLLGASLVKAPPRLIMPAYLAGVIAIFYLFAPHINSKLLGTCVVIITTLAVILHTAFLTEYHLRTAKILNEINQCNCTEVCLEPSQVAPLRLPIIDLSQANILVDWGSPLVIYDKNVTFCK